VASGLSLKQILIRGARELDIELIDDRARACLLYLTELMKWNRKINLTAVRDEREIIIKHFLDSLSYRKGFEPRPALSLLDMGSGAGFPALPLKIACPELTLTLVESVKKKASFLRHIIRTLGLDGVEVMDRRTEDLPGAMHSQYDVVTARAFAAMETTLRQGARFLKHRGVVVLSRGPEELVEDSAIRDIGLETVSRIKLTLPFSDYRRAIWTFLKK
jgi:16S rRNA (guanine527-N7)-methyltransferase